MAKKSAGYKICVMGLCVLMGKKKEFPQLFLSP